MQPSFVGFRVTSLHGTPVFQQHRVVSRFVHIGKCRLVDVEECADLPVVYALVLFPYLFVQLQISLPADNILGVVAVDVFVPVVEQERHALLLFAYRRASCLGIAVRVNRFVLHPFLSE